MANVRKRSPKRERIILESLREYPSYSRAANKADISHTTLKRWRDEDPEFDAAVQQARDAGGEALEDELIDRAIDGKDTTALIFALKTWKREKYGDKVQHTGEITTIAIREIRVPKPEGDT